MPIYLGSSASSLEDLREGALLFGSCIVLLEHVKRDTFEGVHWTGPTLSLVSCSGILFCAGVFSSSPDMVWPVIFTAKMWQSNSQQMWLVLSSSLQFFCIPTLWKSHKSISCPPLKCSTVVETNPLTQAPSRGCVRSTTVSSEGSSVFSSPTSHKGTKKFYEKS